MILKSTPVLTAELIEPVIQFFKDIGFEVTMTVPEGEQLGFAILKRGDVEVMAQNYASIENDIPKIAQAIRSSPSALFIEVSDIDEIAKKIAKYEMVHPKRETFYGATEITVKSPGGHFITFAEFKAED